MAKFSFRDPVTNILKGWGFTNQNQAGDIAQLEDDSFALDLINASWKWNGASWVPFTPPPTPDPDGFVSDMRGLFLTSQWGALVNAHPAFAFAIIKRDYPTIQDQLNSARAASQIGNVMWTNITNFVANRNLPIVLSS